MRKSITVIATPKERDAVLVESLLALARVMPLGQIRICTGPQHVAYYRDHLSQLDCCVEHPLHETRHGVLVQFILTVFEVCRVLPSGATVILVSHYPSLGLLEKWLLRHTNPLQVHAFATLTPSVLSTVYGSLSQTDVDTVAIDLAMSLATTQPRLRVCVWSDLLMERLPTLQDRAQRQALLGTNRYLTYARMLGLTIEGDEILATPQRPLGRPTADDLIAVFMSLQSRNRPVLLLVWTRTVLAHYPGLQHAGVRALLFGDERFKKIAQIIGLRVSGNRICGVPNLPAAANG